MFLPSFANSDPKIFSVATFMLIRFLLFFSLFLLIDWYFFQAVKTLSADWSHTIRTWTHRVYWGFSLFSLLFGILMMLTYKDPLLPRMVMVYIVCFIMVVVFSKLIGSLFLVIDDIQRLVRRIAGLFTRENPAIPLSGGITRAKFLSWSALMLAAVPFASFLYGMVVTAFDFTIRRNKIPVAGLPAAFEGLKIVQISDLHSGSFFSTKPFERAVELILNEQPDVIFFTGDLVNDRSSEAESFINTWKKLSAPLGIFSVLGNHDYGDYVTWDSEADKAANLHRLTEIHREMGWDLLRNEHRILRRNGESIGVIGVENWGAALRFPRKGDLQKARAAMPDVPVKLLLSHDPSHWEAQVLTDHPDIDLTFSGHTHGFQFGVEIPGFRWSPSQWVYKQWAGLYSQGKQHVYVNRGLGFIGYLGRVGIKPEITVMELTKA